MPSAPRSSRLRRLGSPLLYSPKKSLNYTMHTVVQPRSLRGGGLSGGSSPSTKGLSPPPKPTLPSIFTAFSKTLPVTLCALCTPKPELIIIIIIIIIIAFTEIKLTIATCYNDTPNKLPRRTALHCITEHKALARRPSSQPNKRSK